jgi:DNA replication protein DnaC
VRNLKEAEASGRFAKKLQTYLKPAVLVLDEIGYLPLARADANMVFQLIAAAPNAAASWPLPTRPSANGAACSATTCSPSAILDRLLHHCDVISIDGLSYRLKDRLRPSQEVVPWSDQACPATDI